MIGLNNYEEWPTSEIEKTLVNIEMFMDVAADRVREKCIQMVIECVGRAGGIFGDDLPAQKRRIHEQIEIAIKVRERLTGILKERGEI